MPEEHAEYAVKSTAQLAKAAANELFRDGRGHEITTRKIQEMIGQGSNTTIQKALDGWWQDAGTHTVQLESFFDLPDEVAKPLMEAIKVIQEASAQHALKDYEDRINVAQVEMGNMALDRDEAIEDKRQALAEIESLNEEFNTLKETARALEKEIEREAGRADSLEKQIVDIRSEANDKVANAEKEIGKIEEQLDEARGHLKLADQRHDETETRLTALYDEQKTLRQNEGKESDKEISRLRGLLDSANDQLHSLQVANSRDQGTIETQKVAYAAQESEKKAIEAEHKLMIVACARHENTIESLTTKMEELSKEASAEKNNLELKIDQLRKKHDDVVIEKEVLKHDLENTRKQGKKR